MASFLKEFPVHSVEWLLIVIKYMLVLIFFSNQKIKQNSAGGKTPSSVLIATPIPVALYVHTNHVQIKECFKKHLRKSRIKMSAYFGKTNFGIHA